MKKGQFILLILMISQIILVPLNNQVKFSNDFDTLVASPDYYFNQILFTENNIKLNLYNEKLSITTLIVNNNIFSKTSIFIKDNDNQNSYSIMYLNINSIEINSLNVNEAIISLKDKIISQDKNSNLFIKFISKSQESITSFTTNIKNLVNSNKENTILILNNMLQSYSTIGNFSSKNPEFLRNQNSNPSIPFTNNDLNINDNQENINNSLSQRLNELKTKESQLESELIKVENDYKIVLKEKQDRSIETSRINQQNEKIKIEMAENQKKINSLMQNTITSVNNTQNNNNSIGVINSKENKLEFLS